MIEVFGVGESELFQIIDEAGGGDLDFRRQISHRFELAEELGNGGMGTVFLANDRALGRLVALKVVSSEAAAGIGADQLLQEIAHVGRLQHPNILPLFEAGERAGSPYYVMPYVRGGSLRTLLEQRVRFTLSETVVLVHGIARGLSHAHAHRVLHCDVKPENILVDDGHAYVMDFGIAQKLHTEAREWAGERSGLDFSAGTPAYVSPEQAVGDADLDERADIYSLACVVYEMLAGRPPFDGTTTEAVVARRFVSTPAPLREAAPEIPQAAADAIARAMEVRRERRPPTVAQFAQELEQAARRTGRVTERLSVAATRTVGAIRRRAGRRPANNFGGSMTLLAQDARLTLRSLRRNWRFALAFIVPLALGLGAGATFYSIIDFVLYRPPPKVTAPGQLIGVAIATDQFPDPFKAGNTGVAWLDYEALRRSAPTLQSIAAYQQFRPSLGVGENARTVRAILATASYFQVLGVHPVIGRFYSAEEDAQTAAQVPCVASYGLWQSEFGGSRDAIGRSLILGRLRCTVVGVAPKDFNGIGFTSVDFWIPLRAGAEASQGDAALWNTDGSHWLSIIARARPGVPISAVSQEATLAYRSVANRRRDPMLKDAMAAAPLIGNTSSRSSQRLQVARWLVGGAIVLVLLVGANLVNLLVARGLSRVRESAIRIALGGTRGRLFRQSLIECIALSVLAGAASILVVRVVGPIARVALFPGVAWADGPITGRIALLAFVVSIVAGTMIAALTSMQSARLDPAALLAWAGTTRSTGTRRSHRVRMALVAVQAALSVVLLVASAGFIRSFSNAAGSSLGFDLNGIVVADVPNLRTIDSSIAGQRAFYETLGDRVKNVPGVEGVSLGYMSPWFFNRNERLAVPGRDSLPPVPNFGTPAFDAVTWDYLKTMRLTMRAGRWIERTDASGSEAVMVISESLAHLYWPGEANVIGRCIIIGESPTCRQIVGVAQDVRFQGALDSPLIPSFWLPAAQADAFRVTYKLFIRVRGDPDAMVPTIRRIVQGSRANLSAVDVHVMETQLDPLLATWRLGATAFTAIGSVAATIAMLGLFSMMAYLVAERTRDFAIRSALGATASQIAIPVLRQGLVVVGGGAIIGAALSWVASKWLQPLLYHVRLLDGRTVTAVIVALLVVASIAALGPARRAAMIDPINALRSD
jgi:predicted permease